MFDFFQQLFNPCSYSFQVYFLNYLFMQLQFQKFPIYLGMQLHFSGANSAQVFCGMVHLKSDTEPAIIAFRNRVAEMLETQNGTGSSRTQ